MNKTEALDLLPAKKTSTAITADRQKYLVIAPPKFGKTTFAMSFPNSVLLAFEQGHSFLSGHKIVIDAWDKRGFEPWADDEGVNHLTLMMAIDALEAAQDKFATIVIDTVDMMVKSCLDYHLPKKNVEHASDAGEWGKGWDVTQNTPVRRAVQRLLATGRGIIFITHQNVSTAKFASGDKAKKETSLPTGIWKLLYAQADIILHGEFGKQNDKGYRDRIFYTEGSEEMIAGNRLQAILPARFIVDHTNPYKQLNSFFTDPKASEKATKAYTSAYAKKLSNKPTDTEE